MLFIMTMSKCRINISSIQAISKFIEEGNDINGKYGHYGESLLHMASYGGHFDVVKYLVLELGANIDQKDSCRFTPLHDSAVGLSD